MTRRPAVYVKSRHVPQWPNVINVGTLTDDQGGYYVIYLLYKGIIHSGFDLLLMFQMTEIRYAKTHYLLRVVGVTKSISASLFGLFVACSMTISKVGNATSVRLCSRGK
jgi:hypothetical protein